MISLLLSVLLVIFGGVCGESSPLISGRPAQETKRAVIPFNVAGMPARIYTATIEDSLTDSRLDYSVINSAGEDINQIWLQVFVTDSQGKLVKAKENFNPGGIAAGATKNDRERIEGVVGEPGVSFVAVSKIVTRSGVWQVDILAVEAAIRNRLNREFENTLGATFEPHLIVTDSDRAQILQLVLCDIVHDKEKTDRLLGTSQLIVLRSSVNFPMPKIPEKELLALNQDEIQEIAERVQRVVFLNYEPLTVEGSRVLAKIALSDAVTKRRDARVVYHYALVFTCVKKNGRWMIEESTGYAQS